MSSLYKHKKHGWQIRYRIFFPDNSSRIKNRYCRTKERAVLAHRDVDKLEVLSTKNQLEPDDIKFFLNKKYISPADAKILTDKNICTLPNLTWDYLRRAYENHITMVGSMMTRETYPVKANPVIEYFSSVSPLNVTEANINEFILYKRTGDIAKSTINKYLGVLRIMFDHLVSIGALKNNPARKVKYLKVSTERIPRVFYSEDITLLFEKLKDFAYLCRGYFAEMMLTYIFTGMRRYELVFLERSRISLNDEGYLTVCGKGDKERNIDIHPVLYRVFESVLRKNSGRTGRYFFGGHDHTIVKYGETSKAFAKFRKQIDLPQGITLHSLRHTWISHLLKSRADIVYVQKQAGHERIATTQRYAHLIPSEKPPMSSLDFNVDENGIRGLLLDTASKK